MRSAKPLPKRGHCVFELCDCLFPFLVCLRTVGKEGLEYLDELRRVGQVSIEYLLAVLQKDSRVLGFGR